MIEIEDLTKIYPNQKGVSGITFNVDRGEVVGLLGPNGAGKTTVMRMITGYLYPAHGTVRVGGRDLFEDPLGVRRQIGYLPETPPLYPEMSVIGYLRFTALLRGVPKPEVNRETGRVMELTGLGGVREQLIGSLSKGYKQRVGLAQALLNSPPVLILDEPTVGLDPKQIIEIRNLIGGLAKEHTVILSSHILPEVNLICNKIVIIAQGQLVAIDTPDGLTRQLSGGQRVEIEAKGALPEIETLLGSIESIATWSPLDAGPDRENGDKHRFRIESQTPGDIRETLFGVFAAAGTPLLEIRSVSLTLEEIFLQLTTTEETAPEDGAAGPDEAGETGAKEAAGNE